MSTVMDMITQKNKEKMAQKKAEQEGKAALPKEEVGGQMQRLKQTVSAVQPVRTSDKQVLFKSRRPNFAFFLDGSRTQFKQGFLCTEDEVIIKYIKANYVGSFVEILEQGHIGKNPVKESNPVPAILPNGEE